MLIKNKNKKSLNGDFLFGVNMFQGFKPIYDKNSKILILGSFPSVKSRENGFYYGNPQNRFWKMLSQVFDEEIPNRIEDKISFLLQHHIALYDIVEQSDLNGSADNTLERSNKTISNITELLPPTTDVRKIICNGKTSYKLLADNLPEVVQKIEVRCLPSTSSANPRYKFDEWFSALKELI